MSWLPGRALTRSQAVAAMEIAEATVFYEMLDRRDGHWYHVQQCAADLGMTTADALDQADIPPRSASTERNPDNRANPWKFLDLTPDPCPFPEPAYDLEADE